MADTPNEVADRRQEVLRLALQRIVLLRETGPKSAAWQRARIKTMWRLQQQLHTDAAMMQTANTYDNESTVAVADSNG
ncbi:MAG: hypothetical protein KatS3mg055_3326 [Chloroflexus sp.]|uniref:hypothetical protein n=1 Tax=Chloroflexus sp. TaxID=1904827 RepID=UPI0021DD7C66|nr:hypothetical protein [Chloroflexus sp.]GIV90808.1 MAG: hypothetical protein KatS3mg055_3326 [Chloroflexus sp.]